MKIYTTWCQLHLGQETAKNWDVEIKISNH